MDLNRGTLARIDRQLLAGLDTDEQFRMVRVPTSAALWSTWKRYCQAAGVSMGRAVVLLIAQELAAASGESPEAISVLGERIEEQLTALETEVAARERGADATEERLRSEAKRLQAWQEDLAELERRLQGSLRRHHVKVGRNDRCPCGSGLKYKQCHL